MSPGPVLHWSRAAIRALTADSPSASNFSGDAAAYAGIVHLASYDAAAAAQLAASTAASPEVAVATATHHVLVGLKPGLGLTPAVQSKLDDDEADYLVELPNGPAKTAGFAVGEHVVAAISRRALRQLSSTQRAAGSRTHWLVFRMLARRWQTATVCLHVSRPVYAVRQSASQLHS